MGIASVRAGRIVSRNMTQATKNMTGITIDTKTAAIEYIILELNEIGANEVCGSLCCVEVGTEGILGGSRLLSIMSLLLRLNLFFLRHRLPRFFGCPSPARQLIKANFLMHVPMFERKLPSYCNLGNKLK